MRSIGKFLWRFMIIFSFIVNFVLVAILLIAGLFIFQIKAQVADPLIGGLHATAAGLSESTIDWIIPVRDTVPVVLDVPINSDTITSRVNEINGVPVNQIPGETVVRLTRDVPIRITGASIDAGNLQLRNAIVDITLPANTILPVMLDLDLLLDTELDIAIDVRAVIPLSETQLNDPINQLGLLFEPLAIGLHNLPNNFSEAGRFAGEIVDNRQNMGDWLLEKLLSTGVNEGFNTEAYDPWQGFSQTAGYGYEGLAAAEYPEDARPIETGITIPGGIPALDALLPSRAYLYENTNPDGENIISVQAFSATGIPAFTYDGSYGTQYNELQDGLPRSPEEVVLPPLNSSSAGATNDDSGTDAVPVQTDSTNTNDNGSGIIPTPNGN